MADVAGLRYVNEPPKLPIRHRLGGIQGLLRYGGKIKLGAKSRNGKKFPLDAFLQLILDPAAKADSRRDWNLDRFH